MAVNEWHEHDMRVIEAVCTRAPTVHCTYRGRWMMLSMLGPSDSGRPQPPAQQQQQPQQPNSCLSTLSLPSLGEMEQTVCMLERGTIITKYYPRRRPEQKTLMLRRETRQLIWSPVNSSTLARTNQNYEGALDLREIKEVRIGKTSKEFDKWNDESKCVDFTKCFVVYYGSEFKLRSLSVVGEYTHSTFGAWVSTSL